jgi:isopentenyl diphosphate isomerase/L-lactate dehydrogenase-like FMN-dependent dehydrogenase
MDRLARRFGCAKVFQRQFRKDRQFHPRQMRAKAGVPPATAKADMRVRAAADVEAVGLAEARLVAVARDEPQHNLVARRDLPASDLGLCGCGAPHVHHGGD